jgi:nicotinamide-nucleotide amidase
MIDLDELVHKLTDNLRARHLKITSAESCTGGMVACLLTELPGSSVWFERGFVTYSNLAKQQMLAVKPELIKSYGAVSKKIAEEMALGALAHSAALISLAVTGIAGPSGGSIKKPVGTVWFAWAMANLPVQSQHCYFPDVSRDVFRQLACGNALAGAISLINQSPDKTHF